MCVLPSRKSDQAIFLPCHFRRFIEPAFHTQTKNIQKKNVNYNHAIGIRTVCPWNLIHFNDKPIIGYVAEVQMASYLFFLKKVIL